MGGCYFWRVSRLGRSKTEVDDVDDVGDVHVHVGAMHGTGRTWRVGRLDRVE